MSARQWRRSLAGLLCGCGLALLAGCGNDSTSTDTAGDGSASASASPRASADPKAYCDSVRKAHALQPASGPIDRAATARYADAVDQVVAAAPADVREFWAATAKLSRSIADGGQGDPTTASDAFAKLPAVAESTKKACGIDILATNG